MAGMNFKISRWCVESVAYCEMFRSGLHNSLLDSTVIWTILKTGIAKCKIFPAVGGGHPLPDPRPARSLCSLSVLLGGPLTRIFDPSPEKNQVTGLCNKWFCFSFYSYQIRRPTHNRWPRSVGWGGGGDIKGHNFSASKIAQSYKS